MLPMSAIGRSHPGTPGLDDIVAVQDEVTGAIVAAIAPEISQAEIDRSRRKPPESLDSWALYQQGLAVYPSGTQEGVVTLSQI